MICKHTKCSTITTVPLPTTVPLIMSQDTWKQLGVKCGRELTGQVLYNLSSLDVDTLQSLDSDKIKHQIYSSLRPLNGITSAEKLSIAKDLSLIVKYKVQTVAALLIFFGLTPFKIQCRMPDKETIEYEIAKIYEPSIPIIPDNKYQGEFVHIRQLHHVHIYVFSFKNPVACSDIKEGSLHYDLPPPRNSESPISTKEIHERKSKCGAGNVFLHLNKTATDIEYPSEGIVTVKYSYDGGSALDDECTEEQRTEKLFEHLQATLTRAYKDISVNRVEKKNKKRGCNYSFFSGGGDLKVTRTENVVLLMTHVQSEYGDSSPTSEGETRNVFDFELKSSLSKTNKEVQLQLRANMHNLLVREFIDKLKQVGDDQLVNIIALHKLSIYGMSFGISRPVQVLKLTNNFESNCLEYSLKFTSTNSTLPPEPIIDSCIDAIMHRLAKKSP